MKVLTNFFSSAATKKPLITILIVILISGFFGYMAGQGEELNTSFGGELDTPEIKAQSKLGDYFQTSGSQSVFQIILSGEDVLTVDGYLAWEELKNTVSESEIAPYLVSQPGQPLVNGFFAPVDFAITFNPMLNVDAIKGMDDAQFKNLYNQANSQMPAEFKAFASALLSQSYDEDTTTATAGLAIITIDSNKFVEEYGFSEAFVEQPRMEVALNKSLNDISVGKVNVSGFSFGLLFGDEGDDFQQEIGGLFAQAFVIILVVLSYIFFMKGKSFNRKPLDLLRRLLAASLMAFGLAGVITPLVSDLQTPLLDWMQLDDPLLGRMIPLAVFTFGFLLNSRRRASSDLFLSLGAILLSIGWMQGAGTILGPGYLDIIGAPNQVSQIAPIILIGLGVDYAIHFNSRYREEIGSGNSVNGATSSTLKSVGIALTLATLATMVGFLTNIVSPLPELRDFGILVSVGIFFAFFLVMTFVPAIRTLLDRRAENKSKIDSDAFTSSGDSMLNKISEASGIIPKKLKVIALALLVTVSSYGYISFSNLETIFEFTDFLPEDNPVVQTLDLLSEEFGGGFGETTSVLIEGDDLATPEVHNALIESINNLADKENIVVYAGNVAAESVIGSLGQMVAPQSGPPGAPAGPPDMELIGALAGYGVDIMSGKQGIDALNVKNDADVKGLYEFLVNKDAETFLASIYFDENNVMTAEQVRITTSAGSLGAAQLRDDIYVAFAPLIDLGLDVAATNDAIVTQSVSDLISTSQFQSLIFAILASMSFLIIYYFLDMRRPFLGVITILPVIAIVMGTYLGMYYLDIPLNPVTSTLSGLAIGIGVPFVIHVTNRFREALTQNNNPVEAAISTLRTTGGSLFGSAFTTMAGFGILMTSTLKPFQQMGQVVVVALGFALVASILILPTMLVFWANYHNKKTAKSL
ncbi:MAG: MMPL family transporter [Actinomycetota bacterium]|nr:MMPL family transporter [Actinomycetota bacterium]|tara:strand:- start:117 stop:2888 length:2772 start_codon:yes stop_codon:yes gene_type:complete